MLRKETHVSLSQEFIFTTREDDMSQKTVLEKLLDAHEEHHYVIGTHQSVSEIQRVLNRISWGICTALTPQDIVAHVRATYDNSAKAHKWETACTPVIDELIAFANLPQLENEGLLLDLGCGPSVHDTLFLSCSNKEFRSSLMGRIKDGVPTRERLRIPEKMFRVIAADISPEMVRHAEEAIETQHAEWDIFGISHLMSTVHVSDMHDLSPFRAQYSGVWSCNALFMHTPRALVRPALQSIASVLLPKGVFGVSYPMGIEGQYDRLLYLPNGRIMYLSFHSPTFIVNEAKRAGLHLIHQTLGDRELYGKTTKNFFVTQFFEKR